MDASTPDTIIVANGALPDAEVTRQRVTDWLAQKPDLLLIAADGGVHNALSMNLTPAVVIGDLDSLHAAFHERLSADGCHFETAPTRKDETDLELALRYAVRQGARNICILGALGGRLDQTLANILLLNLPMLKGVVVRLVEGHQTAWLVRDETRIQGAQGDTVSIIPLGGDARGVTTEGLEYPLKDATLLFGPSLGISNVMTGERARVTVREGVLLIVHTAGGTYEQTKRTEEENT